MYFMNPAVSKSTFFILKLFALYETSGFKERSSDKNLIIFYNTFDLTKFNHKFNY